MNTSAAIGRFIALSAALGCTGTIGDDAPAEPIPQIEWPEPDDLLPTCEGNELASTAFRLLSRGEYDRSMSTLIGEPVTAAAQRIAGDGLVDGHFVSNVGKLITLSDFTQYHLAGQEIARAALANGRISTACVGEEGACVDAFLEDFARQAYRRPLSDAEAEAFRGQFQARRDEGDDYGEAIGVLAHTVLVSPQTLFHAEVGTPDASGNRKLSGYEVASRLSFLFLGEAPDNDLLDRAASGELDDVEGVERVAREMVEDERAVAQLERFIAGWSDTRELSPANAVPDRGLTEVVIGQMLDERAAYAEALMSGDTATIRHLLTSRTTRVGPELADFYGVSVEAAAAGEWGEQPRSGLFTHGGTLVMGSKGGNHSPTARGRQLREQILCQVVADLPGDAEAQEVIRQNGETRRELSERQARTSQCAQACHSTLNPMGFALEHFDHLGAYQSSEVVNEETQEREDIDASGELRRTDNDGPFENARDLFALLADSPAVHHCISSKVASFVFQTERSDDLVCVAEAARLSMSVGADTRIPELLIAIATSDSFRFRRGCP